MTYTNIGMEGRRGSSLFDTETGFVGGSNNKLLLGVQFPKDSFVYYLIGCILFMNYLLNVSNLIIMRECMDCTPHDFACVEREPTSPLRPYFIASHDVFNRSLTPHLLKLMHMRAFCSYQFSVPCTLCSKLDLLIYDHVYYSVLQYKYSYIFFIMLVSLWVEHKHF